MKRLKNIFLVVALLALMAFAFAFASSAETGAPSVANFTVAKQSPTSLTLQWETGEEPVSGFKLYKYQKANKKTTLIATLKKEEMSFKVGSLLSGTDYCFKLKAYIRSGGETVYSETAVLETYTTLPKVTGLALKSNSDVSQELTWNTVKGVGSYSIYYFNKTTGKYVLMGSKPTNEAVIKCSPATLYKYRVKATAVVEGGKTKISGKLSDPLEAVSRASLVSSVSVSEKTSSSITLEWEAAKKAEGYKIYQYDSAKKKYVAAKTVRGETSAVIDNLKSAKQYKFKIRSFTKVEGTNVFSEPSSVIAVITKPETPVLSQNSDAVLNGRISLSWTKSPRAKGYLIYISDHKNSGFTLYKEVDGSTDSTVVSGVKNGAKQYVKIKAYVEIEGAKVYGDYSKIITVYA